MKDDIKSKFLSSMKGAASAMPEDDESSSEGDESSPMFDLATKLCDALGVDDSKADAVAEVLMDLQDMLSPDQED